MDKLNDVLERARLMHKHLRPIMVDIGEIEAIAEAFRALEQENIQLKQGCENNPLVHEMVDWRERAEVAEAKQDCNHDWFTLHYGHTEAIYGCKKCGQYKTGQGSY